MNLIQSLKRKSYVIPALLLLLHTLAWYIMHPVPPTGPGDDALEYVNNAKSVFSSGFHVGFDQFQNRFGVYVPVHFLFLLFGTSAWIVSLWPLLVSLTTILMVYVFLNRLTGKRVAVIAAALIAVNLEQVTYSLVLFPDLLVAFYAGAVILVLYYARTMSRNKIVSAVYLQLLWILGFLTKETMLLTLPFIALVAANDVIHKRHLDFWRPTLLIAILSSLLLAGFYYLLTGDAFHRLKSMTNYLSVKVDPNDEQSANIRAHNSSNLLVWINRNLHYLFILLLSIPMIYRCFREKWSGLRTYMSVYALYLLMLFAILFHTPHVSELYMESRHWMFLIFPLSVLAAWTIHDFNRQSLWFVMGALGVLAMYNFWAAGAARSMLFGLFLAGALADYYFFVYKGKRYYLLLLPFLVLLGYFIETNTNLRPQNALRQEEIQSQK
jgi:4-amino-4-deoxy-L-arabinose transferase-like glycosyltransferase